MKRFHQTYLIELQFSYLEKGYNQANMKRKRT